jgi:hypothetical protein
MPSEARCTYLDDGFASVRRALPMRFAIRSVQYCHSRERLPQQASGYHCTPPQGRAACDRSRCYRCPQPHLTRCFMPTICVALQESCSAYMHDRHMLPTLMYTVHALTADLASLQPERVHRPQQHRHAIRVVQGSLDLPHMSGSAAHVRSHICPPKYWWWMTSPIWSS